jgi:hypothetical protein
MANGKTKRKQNTRKQKTQNNINSTIMGIRTRTFTAEYNKLIGPTDTLGFVAIQPNSTFPKLKTVVSGAIQYRFTQLQVTWTSVDTSTTWSVANVLTYIGGDWKPLDSHHDIVSRGGVIKPAKNSGWKSNILPHNNDWYDISNPASNWYYRQVGGAANTAEVGTIHITVTVQMRGQKE